MRGFRGKCDRIKGRQIVKFARRFMDALTAGCAGARTPVEYAIDSGSREAGALGDVDDRRLQERPPALSRSIEISVMTVGRHSDRDDGASAFLHDKLSTAIARLERWRKNSVDTLSAA
jgi:hypothetical protein